MYVFFFFVVHPGICLMWSMCCGWRKVGKYCSVELHIPVNYLQSLILEIVVKVDGKRRLKWQCWDRDIQPEVDGAGAAERRVKRQSFQSNHCVLKRIEKKKKNSTNDVITYLWPGMRSQTHLCADVASQIVPLLTQPLQRVKDLLEVASQRKSQQYVRGHLNLCRVRLPPVRPQPSRCSPHHDSIFEEKQWMS